MQSDYRDNKALSEDLALLKSQVDQCRDSLHQLAQQAGQYQHAQPQPLRAYCNQLIDKWLLMRPQVKADINVSSSAPDTSSRAPQKPTMYGSR